MKTVYICGDSTASYYPPEQEPAAGWGQALQGFMPEGITVSNEAIGGRSSKSFLGEGRLNAIEARIQPGDLLLIQFTHNDAADHLIWRHTQPWGSFQDNLRIFVLTAQRHGAQPVLLTPVCRWVWDEAGENLRANHGDYPEAVRCLAREMGVPLIDVFEKSCAHLQALGMERSRALFMHVAPGVYPYHKEGKADSTHTSREGAQAFAGIVAEGLRAIGAI
ncbi:MAG: rhamnogalacturonan acetylesterase [Oscillospiraceae bacterium]|jgi:lysophospholipase L1-like esterase|nr:rhamnogalacturonan acetylesterase [Oscillospiraceae bacterium]